ncbi:hypothetical protein [Pandoraea sp. ISTKB]|uniref:hypothetical protein n=1 Tax=Pandoraea sp. ISTKB TaxID=1586708 RepID=UPI000846F71C|nr:hypothetical protein [Pandoraea sp. ISTKB]ODP30733.1 hypothetical protein A9762_27705 [Pandoraea sp. ISTKB]
MRVLIGEIASTSAHRFQIEHLGQQHLIQNPFELPGDLSRKSGMKTVNVMGANRKIRRAAMKGT